MVPSMDWHLAGLAWLVQTRLYLKIRQPDLVQVCKGVEAMHNRSPPLAHRDIKVSPASNAGLNAGCMSHVRSITLPKKKTHQLWCSPTMCCYTNLMARGCERRLLRSRARPSLCVKASLSYVQSSVTT